MAISYNPEQLPMGEIWTPKDDALRAKFEKKLGVIAAHIGGDDWLSGGPIRLYKESYQSTVLDSESKSAKGTDQVNITLEIERKIPKQKPPSINYEFVVSQTLPFVFGEFPNDARLYELANTLRYDYSDEIISLLSDSQNSSSWPADESDSLDEDQPEIYDLQSVIADTPTDELRGIISHIIADNKIKLFETRFNAFNYKIKAGSRVFRKSVQSLLDVEHSYIDLSSIKHESTYKKRVHKNKRSNEKVISRYRPIDYPDRESMTENAADEGEMVLVDANFNNIIAGSYGVFDEHGQPFAEHVAAMIGIAQHFVPFNLKSVKFK